MQVKRAVEEKLDNGNFLTVKNDEQYLTNIVKESVKKLFQE